MNVSGPSGIVWTTLIANTPQLVLTILYFTVNSLVTSMLLSREWRSYLTNRKSLRVSSPKQGSKQRTTYWLSLPYRYSIPLVIGAALLHWLISQSLFLVHVTALDDQDNPDPQLSIATCGYSYMPLIATQLLAATILAVTAGLGLLKRYEGGMPLAGSCSARISAACHPPQDDLDAALQDVQFGELVADHVEEDEEGRKKSSEAPQGDELMPRHCCFTSHAVRIPNKEIWSKTSETFSSEKERLADKFAEKLGVDRQLILFNTLKDRKV